MKYEISIREKDGKTWTRFKFSPIKEFEQSSFKRLFTALGEIPRKTTSRAIHYELEGDWMKLSILTAETIEKMAKKIKEKKQ